MITDEMAAKFNLPPLKEYPFNEAEWYSTFLAQSDHEVIKAMEAMLTGAKPGADVDDVIKARQEARNALAELSESEPDKVEEK